MTDIRNLGRHLPRARAWLAAAGLPVLVGTATPAWAWTTERVSVGPHGVQGNGNSGDTGEIGSDQGEVAISADGKVAAFVSFATNLVPGDTNRTADIFVHDGRTGRTERVSVGPRGRQANGFSGLFRLAMSANGRFVAFESLATNLVPGGDRGQPNIFVRDRTLGTTEQVDLGPGGVKANSDSTSPSMSGDGRFVAFESDATNLVPDDTNGWPDVFVRDRKLGTTERVSVGQDGVQGNATSDYAALSADGRFVAFYSEATGLLPGDTGNGIYVRDRQAGTIERIDVGPHGIPGNNTSIAPVLSEHGRYVAFLSYASNLVPGDTNKVADVLVRDRWTGQIERVSLRPDGGQFTGDSGAPSISADGRFVAFTQFSCTDPEHCTGRVFVRDRTRRKTTRASVGPGGVEANASSFSPAISADGRSIAFVSYATNLVPGDTNGYSDVFVRTR